MGRIRLYCGLVKDGKWYNYTEPVETVGGALAVLDGADPSGAAKLLNLVRASVKSVFTENGDEYALSEYEYEDFIYEDCWLIGLHCMKHFTGMDKPVFDEYFFCKACSTFKNEKYTKIRESWFDLIDNADIDENYMESPDELEYDTELPVGADVAGNKKITGGVFNNITRTHITIGQMIKISKIQFDAEIDLVFAIWDAQIVAVDGMSDQDIKRLIKRSPKNSFTKKYLTSSKDQEEMRLSTPEIGIDASERLVSCKNCNEEIGGYLDFTNFFEFLSPKQSGRQIKVAK